MNESMKPLGVVDQRTAYQIVEEQALDDGLWFQAVTAPEAYLQQELRRLHAAVERDYAALRTLEAEMRDMANTHEVRPRYWADRLQALLQEHGDGV